MKVIPKKIVLMVLDTLRADRLGCYGYLRNTSPHLDEIRNEGTLFRFAFSPCSYTVPSHASLFTGKLPQHHSSGFSNSIPTRALDEDIFLGEVLSDMGYETAAFISSFVLSKMNGGAIARGFRIYDDAMVKGELNRPDFLIRKGRDTNLRVLDWLRGNYAKNFFLFIHYFDIHGPYEHEEPYKSLFLDTIYEQGRGYLDRIVPDSYALRGIPEYQVLGTERDVNGQIVSFEKNVAYYLSQYDSGIRYVDDCVGDVVRELRTLNIYDDTLLIITSDHGEAMGENDVWFFHGLTVSQEQIHVPLIVKPHNGLGPVPRTVWQQVSLVDIFPTLCETVGVDTGNFDVDGFSLLDYLCAEHLGPFCGNRKLKAEIEGQEATIDKLKIIITPKEVDRSNLHYFYLEELCSKSSVVDYRIVEDRCHNMVAGGNGEILDLKRTQRAEFVGHFVRDKKVLLAFSDDGREASILSKYVRRLVSCQPDSVLAEHTRLQYASESLCVKNESFLNTKSLKSIEGGFDVIIATLSVPLSPQSLQETVDAMRNLLNSPQGICIFLVVRKFCLVEREAYTSLSKTLSKAFSHVSVFGHQPTVAFQIARVTPGHDMHEVSERIIDLGPNGYQCSYAQECCEDLIILGAESSEGSYFDRPASFYLDHKGFLLSKNFDNTKILEKAIWRESLEVNRLNQNIEDLKNELRQIYESNGWRMLRKAYELRNKLFPMGSYRRRIGSVLWKKTYGLLNQNIGSEKDTQIGSGT